MNFFDSGIGDDFYGINSDYRVRVGVWYRKVKVSWFLINIFLKNYE